MNKQTQLQDSNMKNLIPIVALTVFLCCLKEGLGNHLDTFYRDDVAEEQSGMRVLE